MNVEDEQNSIHLELVEGLHDERACYDVEKQHVAEASRIVTAAQGSGKHGRARRDGFVRVDLEKPVEIVADITNTTNTALRVARAHGKSHAGLRRAAINMERARATSLFVRADRTDPTSMLPDDLRGNPCCMRVERRVSYAVPAPSGAVTDALLLN